MHRSSATCTGELKSSAAITASCLLAALAQVESGGYALADDHLHPQIRSFDVTLQIAELVSNAQVAVPSLPPATTLRIARTPN